VEAEITPEPSEQERRAILAALEAGDDETSDSPKPWLEEASEP
jgi:hypothetical protein